MNASINTRNNDLIRSIFKKILLPALAAGASANIATMIDGIVVGNAIGSEALAAVNSCRPASQIYGFLSEILASGVAVSIARSVGKSEKGKPDKLFTTGISAALIAAVVLTLVQQLFAGNICRLFADDEELYPLALEYYRIFSLSVFFILFNNSLSSAMRTDGYPKLSALVQLLPHIVNALLNVLFVSVFDMGLSGVAIATVLGYFAAFLVGAYYFFFRKSYRLLRGNFGRNLAEITSVGTPPAVNMGLISIKLLIINSLVLSVGGSLGMAVMSLIMVEWALESLFISGVKQSMMPMISYYYANGDYHGVRAVFNYAFRFLMTAEAALVLLFEVFPQFLPFIFGMREPEQISAACVGIRIFALSMPLEAFAMLTISYYTAIRNRKTAVVLSVLLGLVATVSVIYPLAHFFGINGVWLSFPVAELIPLALIAILSRLNSERFFRMKGHTYLQEFSVDVDQLSHTVDCVRKAVGDAGFDAIAANRTGLAIEEMALSALERNSEKKVHIDVTVRKIEDALLVTFSDDGMEFDPVTSADREAKTSSLAMLKAISAKMEYGRIVGMNKTDIYLQ
ncbi:MAG: MATE family efflux transporter [Eubacteriales bacterium]|nr:MATE family efflux transporter [Eubacteriales bacterium]